MSMADWLIEPVWKRVDPEEIRDEDEDEQMTQISINCGRYYCEVGGIDLGFYEKKLEEAKECLNLPDDYDKPGCEWHIGVDPDDLDDDWNERSYIWLRGNENAFKCCEGEDTWYRSYDLAQENPMENHRDGGYNYSCFPVPLEPQIMEEIGRINRASLSFDDDDDWDEVEMRRREPIINILSSMEITPKLRKELREERVKMYQELCEYYREHGVCLAPNNDGCLNVENCCSFEKIDSCFCGFDKNKYCCILTPCCGHKMHLRCLYAWYEKKEDAEYMADRRPPTGTVEHCPYCRANWDDYGSGFWPPQ